MQIWLTKLEKKKKKKKNIYIYIQNMMCMHVCCLVSYDKDVYEIWCSHKNIYSQWSRNVSDILT